MQREPGLVQRRCGALNPIGQLPIQHIMEKIDGIPGCMPMNGFEVGIAAEHRDVSRMSFSHVAMGCPKARHGTVARYGKEKSHPLDASI